MLTVSVLGPIEIRRDGQPITVPAGRSTEVLVRLALEAGVLVRTERLIEDLWADAAGTGKNTVQSKISQVRRGLGDPGLVVSGNGGYTLDIARDCVDALRVEGVATEVAARRRAGDATSAVALATEGLGLFRGEVLVDAGDGEWLHAHRVRLEEVRLGLIEDQLAARVDLGGGGEVIGALEEHVHRHPLREGLWSSLITALYRAGRQADALAAYTRVRELLIEELGIEPGPELRSLEAQVLQQSSSLGRPAPAAPRLDPPSPTGNLPALTTELVGRADEVADVQRRLDDRRLVTLVGPAGVGKTRVAIEVARGWATASGAWLVRLDAADASTSIAQMVAETMNLSGGEPMLFDRVASADVLLVLDNCEHVIDGVADLVARLLDGSSKLRVLATSQQPLGLDGETVVTLGPLPTAESILLFTQRAEEMRAQFELDADTRAVVEEVCASLDGLPLAIELAAARVKSLSVREIARRLDDRFALLQDPTSRRPERRRALAAAIGWSYELLFPDDQRGLWALSCFAGGAPLAAAEHVLEALGVPPASAVDVVGRLVDRSLVSVEFTADDRARYRLLDSIRAFAADRLREAGLDGEAGAAHAEWFAAEADRCDELARGSSQPTCISFVRAERANIDAALAWAATHDSSLGLRLANGFAWSWVVLGDGTAGAARVRVVLAGGQGDPRAIARARNVAGWLEASAGDVGRAEGDLDVAAAVAEELGDEHLRADVRRHQAFLRIQQGRFQDVLDLTAASLAFSRPAGLDWETAGALLLAAFASMVLGDTGGAATAAQEAVRLLEPIGDDWALVHGDAILGAIAQADHRLDEAAASVARAAASSEQLGFSGQAALHLTNLGRIQQQAGSDDAAITTLRRAIVAAATSGDLRMASTARVRLARVLRGREGDAEADGEAETLLQTAAAWYAGAGGGDGALLTRALLAALAAARGDEGSDGELRAVLAAARAADEHETEVEVLTLDARARFAAGHGDLAAAAELLREADDLAATVAHVIAAEDRHDAAIARAMTSPAAIGPAR